MNPIQPKITLLKRQHTCDKCNGVGHIEGSILVDYAYVELTSKVCDKCGGTGTVEYIDPRNLR